MFGFAANAFVEFFAFFGNEFFLVFRFTKRACRPFAVQRRVGHQLFGTSSGLLRRGKHAVELPLFRGYSAARVLDNLCVKTERRRNIQRVRRADCSHHEFEGGTESHGVELH